MVLMLVAAWVPLAGRDCVSVIQEFTHVLRLWCEAIVLYGNTGQSMHALPLLASPLHKRHDPWPGQRLYSWEKPFSLAPSFPSSWLLTLCTHSATHTHIPWNVAVTRQPLTVCDSHIPPSQETEIKHKAESAALTTQKVLPLQWNVFDFLVLWRHGRSTWSRQISWGRAISLGDGGHPVGLTGSHQDPEMPSGAHLNQRSGLHYSHS